MPGNDEMQELNRCGILPAAGGAVLAAGAAQTRPPKTDRGIMERGR